MFPNLSEIHSLSLMDRESIFVRVEVGIRKGLPLFQILGLASQNTKESKDRIRIALEASGYEFPFDTVIINLDPNHKPKKVSFFDLAIALGILEATGQWSCPFPGRLVALGSLSLSGKITAPNELVELLWAAPKQEGTVFMIPSDLKDTRLPNASYLFLDSLRDISGMDLSPLPKSFETPSESESVPSWEKEILTPSQMKTFTGLCYGLLGRHHCLVIGNPGTGKTKLVKMLSCIQPKWEKSDFDFYEGIPFHSKVTTSGKLKPRPFRNPHHTITEQALVGGGNTLSLGEVSLAHGGILFLDEITFFKEKAIEALREPMEEKKIEHARVLKRESLPADCTVIAAMNPCPCGNFKGIKNCPCSKKQLRDYIKKISGPFIDRITIHLQLFANEEKRLVEISRLDYKKKLMDAVEFRNNRKKEELKTRFPFNAKISDNNDLTDDNLHFSFRQKRNIMHLARTIADFNLSPMVQEHHLLEAYEFVENSLLFEELK